MGGILGVHHEVAADQYQDQVGLVVVRDQDHVDLAELVEVLQLGRGLRVPMIPGSTLMVLPPGAVILKADWPNLLP